MRTFYLTIFQLLQHVIFIRCFSSFPRTTTSQNRRWPTKALLSLDTSDNILADEYIENRVGLNINFDPEFDSFGNVIEFGEGETSDDDPYADILNLKKPLAYANSSSIISASSILQSENDEIAAPPSTYSSLVNSRSATGLMSNFKRWEHWDAFMEAELGDIDAELKDSDRWIQELRDLVEQKRGFAIWSKRSDKEIQKEMKKSLASRGMMIPPNVAMVITAVYIEKTHTMKALREEEELACLEFRKWIMEQKKKNKKDPIITAKVDLSKKWLLRHPSSSSSGLYSSLGKKGKAIIRKKPSTAAPYVKKPATLVVLDEVTTSVPASGQTAPAPFAALTTSSTPLPPTHSLMAPSVQNWDKSPAELLSSATNPSTESDSPGVGAGFRPTKGNVIEIFKVDDVAMYIPNYCAPNTDYYVVL